MKMKKTTATPTFALGFNVDFSEDNDPIDELGDKAGALEAVLAALVSDVDDVELPGRPREFMGSVTRCTLPDLSSKCSPELVFSGIFVSVVTDTPTFSEPLLLVSTDDCKST